MIFEGVFTALVTPFKSGKVDYKSLKKLVRFQLEHGIQGFVVNGTTGESPTLEDDAIAKIVTTVKGEGHGAVPLILGAGSNSTKEAIKKAKWAAKFRPDAIMSVVPYYNKPTQQGIVQHFREIAKATKVPLMVYNVPGRTVVSMSAESIVATAKIKGICGIKEASGNLELLHKIQKAVGTRFALFSGDDFSAVSFCSQGGHGVISVISHVIPRELVDLVSRARTGAMVARADYQKFDSLNRLMGIESNPIPVKAALQIMGIIESAELRLPMTELSKANKLVLAEELKKLGLV